MLMKAKQKSLEDENEKLHILAWLINMAGQRDGKGKPKYRTFNQFYKPKQDDRFDRLKEHLRSKNVRKL